MTPDFALSLSTDGIRVLHRVPGGWHLVGEADLASETLDLDLAALRDRAKALAVGPLYTKLLIPNDQIKFIAIDTTQTTQDDIDAAIDGETPYALHELTVDFDRSGGRTHVAVVAKDTLSEAETFTTRYGFNPVSFAAVAPPYTFRSEVFFGPTKLAETLLPPGEGPVRDDSSVSVIGVAHQPQPDPVPAPAPEAAPESEPTPEPAPEPETVAAPDATDAPVFSARHRSTGPDTAPAPAEAAPPPVADTATDAPSFASRRSAVVAAAEAVSPAAAPAPAPDADDVAMPNFTTIRAERGQPASPPAVTDPVAPAAAVAAPVAEPVAEPIAETVAETVSEAAPAPQVAALRAERTQTEVETAAPEDPAPRGFLRRRRAKAAATDTTAGTAAPRGKKAAPDKAAEELTVFGARAKPKVGGKPRFLGLMLTAGLLVFLFIVALWASTLDEGGVAGWFRGPQLVEPEGGTVQTATAPIVLPVSPEPERPVTSAPSALEDAPVAAPEETAPLPVVRAPVGRVLSPAEAERIYAATGVYQRAPRIPFVPQEATLDGFVEYAAQAATPQMAALSLPDTDALALDLPLRAQPVPPPPGTRYQRDLRGFILAMPDGTVTPSGALVFAGSPDILPPARPGTQAPEAPVLAPASGGAEGLILIAGPPPVLPIDRPEGLGARAQAVALVTDATDPAAEADADAPDLLASDLGLPADPAAPDALPELPQQDLTPTVEAALPDPAATATTPTDTGAAPEALPLDEIAEAVRAALPETSEEVPLADAALPLVETPETLETAALDPEATTTAAPVADPAPEAVPETVPQATAPLDLILGTPPVSPPVRPVEFAALSTSEVVSDAVSASDLTAGIDLTLGRPPLEPPLRPATIGALAEATAPATLAEPVEIIAPGGVALAGLRPSERPGALVPDDVVRLGAIPELAGYRPSLRPEALAPETEPEPISSVIAAIADAAPEEAFVTATAQAVSASPRPDTRPRNFAQVVSRAEALSQRRQQRDTAAATSAAVASNQVARPTGPIPGGVARAATIDNAMRLRDINLIGVFGRPNDRRALVRMANGRYVRVEVGSRLDGGRVTAINDSSLRYTKSGRSVTLNMPG